MEKSSHEPHAPGPQAAMGFSLYVHIPYCQSKCPYCDFNSHAVLAWPEDDYVQALKAEMRFRAEQPPWTGRSLATLFFGGGTPSLFAPRSIDALIQECDRLWGLLPDCEVTLEANPGTVESARLAGMRAAGVNRLSLGAQSFDPRILAALGRLHGAEHTRAAVAAAKAARFDHLNLDLIFAVPGQSLDGVRNDLLQAVALEPDHISAYNLTFEEGTLFGAQLRRGAITPLPDDEQADMYALVRSELPGHGYRMYEISNFARPRGEARHNLTYWRAESYLGLGAGAHSFARGGAGGRRWWNERGPGPYIARARETGSAEAGSETIDARTGAAEFVFLNLRLSEGFAAGAFQDRFGTSFEELFEQQVRPLIEGGLLLKNQERFMLSDRGVELADAIFARFI